MLAISFEHFETGPESIIASDMLLQSNTMCTYVQFKAVKVSKSNSLLMLSLSAQLLNNLIAKFQAEFQLYMYSCELSRSLFISGHPPEQSC